MMKNDACPAARKVWALIAAGHSNKEIACRLFRSEHTIKVHIGTLLKKTGTSNRVQLALEWHGVAWREAA